MISELSQNFDVLGGIGNDDDEDESIGGYNEKDTWTGIGVTST